MDMSTDFDNFDSLSKEEVAYGSSSSSGEEGVEVQGRRWKGKKPKGKKRRIQWRKDRESERDHGGYYDLGSWCHHCEEQFETSQRVIEHQNSVHSDMIKFKCVCGRGYPTQAGVREHALRRHKKKLR